MIDASASDNSETTDETPSTTEELSSTESTEEKEEFYPTDMSSESEVSTDKKESEVTNE